MLYTINDMKENLAHRINNRMQQVKIEFNCILIMLFLSGSVTVSGQETGSTLTNDKVDESPKSELAGENLTPYQPSG